MKSIKFMKSEWYYEDYHANDDDTAFLVQSILLNLMVFQKKPDIYIFIIQQALVMTKLKQMTYLKVFVIL